MLRNIFHMSQEVFGKRLGVTGAGISKIESGKRNLTEQMLLLICKEFNINENWLRYGEGEMLSQKLPNAVEQLAQYYQLDDLDKKIIYEYTMLEDKKRQVIKEYIMKIAFGCSNPSIQDSALLRDGNEKKEILLCAEND